MKSAFTILTRGIFLTIALIASNLSTGQISAPSSDNTISTSYTSGAPNDNIYVFCLPNQATGNIASLTGVPPGGAGPWTFDWSQYNTGTFSFAPFSSSVGATSTINNLPDGGYFLSVTDNGGNNVGCYIAWVFNNETNIDVANIAAGCGNFQLNGTADPIADFVYYNPPQANSLIIDATTVIDVCFDATHTWISDLGFYLVSPCGQTILLSPNPGSNGQGTVCNMGDDVNNLCFTTSAAATLDPCTAPAPYTGSYDSYGPPANVTNIDWTPLYGCDAALGGWSVQIYDCIGGDVGTLDHSSINFSGMGACGPTNVNYDSGAISSVINDNSCTPGSASIFTVPPPVLLTTPIVLANTIVSFQWTSDNPCVTIPNATTSLNPNINPVPDTDTWFYLTATDNFGCTNLVDSAQFINTCPCPITNVTSNILPCNSAPATFDITGQVIFSNPPCIGQLTVTNCSGDQQVFNAPFVSPINYNLTNIPADGTAGCTVTANFTNDPAACTGFSTAVYTEPITPDVFDIVDTINCDDFTLPAITGTNLTGNESYYTGPNGTGGAMTTGTVITTTQTVYIYDQTATVPFCFDEESFLVTINIAPTVTNITETCNGTNTGYFVSFDANGGTGGPYTVVENAPGGVGGTWVGNTWTSNLITSGVAYDFDIDDVNGCGPINITGSLLCACVTSAGTMNVTPLNLCESVQANAIHNGDNVFDGNDAMIFVLHDNSGGILGTILATNTTADFNFVSPPLSYGTTYYISAIAGDDDLAGGVDLLDPCLSVANGTPVVWNEEPTADIAGTATICNGGNTNLTITLTGSGPFDVVYTDGMANFNLNGITTPHVFAVSPTATTNYTLISVVDAVTGCAGTVTGNANITVNNPPIITNITETCNGTNTAYTVSFDVNGGTGGPYTVTENLPGGIGGTWAGNTWTSNLIPSGTAYNFDVDDINACGPINVNGSLLCNCATNAGTMNVTPLSLCENVQANAIHNGDQNFDANDVMIFVLHDNNGGTLGTILATNTTPDFNFTNPPLAYGTTYYISAVVGDDDLAGGVLLTDPCLSVATGTPVVWNQLPTADISGTTSICSAANAGLTIALTGVGPFDVVYTDGISNFNLNGITNPHNFNVNPTVTTNYTLVSVTDLGTTCAGTVTGNANITIFTLPVISNIVETCNATNTAYTVSFDVAGGTGGPYTVTENLPGGIGGTWAGNTWTSNLITSGTAYDFDVDDVNGCGPANANGSLTCNCTTNSGTMDPVTLNLCETADANATHNSDETFDGDDVIMFVLHDNNGGTLGTILGTNSVPDFSYNASLIYGTTYYISAVVGNNDGTGNVDLLDPCLSVANGTPVIWHEMPTADAGLDAAICEGDTYVLSGVATGASITTWATTGDGLFDNTNILGAEYTPGVIDITNGNVTLTLAAAPAIACPIVFDNMILTINSLPTAVDFSPTALCEDIVGGGSTSGIDLTSNDNIVNGGTANNVIWYSDNNLTTLVGNPSNATATNGQIFYVLVSNGNCQDTAEVTYTINSRPIVLNQTPNAGCEDTYGSSSVAGVDLTLLEPSIEGGNGFTVNWYSDAGLSTSVTAPNNVTVSNGQVYYAEVIGNGNCTSIATITYDVNPIPTASFSSDPNPATLFDPNINFTNTSFGGASIDSNYWSFDTLGFSNDANPSFTFPADTGTYLITLFIQDLNGCENSTTESVTVKGEFGIFIPSAFTPDADGINDVFFPNGFGITDDDYNFYIFNRWGEIIFESHKNFGPWDGTYKGKLVPNGAYPWKLFFTDINGLTHTKVGHVNVLR